MTKLIYPQPIEINGKLIVSTEILTHYRCPRCNLFSSASDIETIEIFCSHCGLAIRLPESAEDKVMIEGWKLEKMNKAILSFQENIKKPTKGNQVMTNALSPDAGMPQRGVK